MTFNVVKQDPLIAAIGADATERLLYRYLNACRPRRWKADEGAQFGSWLAATLPSLSATSQAVSGGKTP
jgi:hypothetical protein